VIPNRVQAGQYAADVRSEIEIPISISVEYLRQQVEKRRQSLLVRRAAIINELARRRDQQQADLQIQDLVLMPSETLETPRNSQDLPVTYGQYKDFFLSPSDLSDE
jgi:hypothetical protein